MKTYTKIRTPTHSYFLLSFLFSILFLPNSLLAQQNELVNKTIPSPGAKWMVAEVSQEYRTQTFVLMGRIQYDSLSFLNESMTWDSYPLPFQSTLNTENSSQPKFENKSSPSILNTPNINLDGLSVSYSMTRIQINRCEKNSEFKTFLSQLSLFKGLFYEMELTASSNEFAECASRIAQQIIAKGFKVNVNFGSLLDGGINLRAYLGQYSSPNENQPPSIQSIFGLVAKIGLYKKVNVRILSDGYFLLSFAIQPKNLELDVLHENEIIKNIKIDSLPLFKLGENNLEGFGAKTLVVRKAFMDSFKVEIIPDSIIQSAIDEQTKFQNQYRWSVKNKINYRTLSGSGLAKSELTQYIPIDLVAQQILNDRFQLNFRLMPEVFFGDDEAPKTNFMSAGLSYALLGLLKRHYRDPSPILIQTGLSGFYLQNRTTTSAINNVFLLSDLLALSLDNKITWQFHNNWTAAFNFDLIPTVSTQDTKTSLSTSFNFELERCGTLRHCFSIGYGEDNYELEYTTFSTVSFNTKNIYLGYRILFQ